MSVYHFSIICLTSYLKVDFFVFRGDFQEQSRTMPSNGDILVICCEGNAGFYEGGCMCTPLELGFSILGWNHPGFLESSVRNIVANETFKKFIKRALWLIKIVRADLEDHRH